MAAHRFAVVGAGRMARVRGRGLLRTGRVEICGVASRHLETARACAQELGCPNYYDDYRRLEQLAPEALLIEVPHAATCEIALWALERGYHLYIGGPIAASVEEGERLVQVAEEKHRIIEAGYNGRYDRFVQRVRALIKEGALGVPVCAQSLALYDADRQTWYYSEEVSGGMPLTHMSYCYLDTFRWILGEVKCVLAASNRKAQTAAGMVMEETCAATLVFADDTVASLLAGYVSPKGYRARNWRIVCTEGVVESEGQLVLHKGNEVDMDFEVALPDDQSAAFLDAIEGKGGILCPGRDALQNILIAKAISRAAQTRQVVELGE